MGHNVHYSKCAAHNRILARLETCPQCVQTQREQAIAKAGPKQNWYGRGQPQPSIGMDWGSESFYDRIRSPWSAAGHTSGLAIECECEYCTKLRAEMSVERRVPRPGVIELRVWPALKCGRNGLIVPHRNTDGSLAQITVPTDGALVKTPRHSHLHGAVMAAIEYGYLLTYDPMFEIAATEAIARGLGLT